MSQAACLPMQMQSMAAPSRQLIDCFYTGKTPAVTMTTQSAAAAGVRSSVNCERDECSCTLVQRVFSSKACKPPKNVKIHLKRGPHSP